MKVFLNILAAAAVGTGVILFIFLLCLFIMMLIAANGKNENLPQNVPVIVPGCKIRGDKPRSTLKRRLDAALIYLKEHERARCCVCGGFYGKFTQAEVMKKYLVEHGIDEKRVLTDNKSKTTYENMKNARELLPDIKEVFIATNVYHLYRSKFFAEKFGFVPYSIKASTPLTQMWFSWPREFTAVLKAWIKGK